MLQKCKEIASVNNQRKMHKINIYVLE